MKTSPKRQKTGTIISTKMQGTVTVRVTEYHRHAKYAKDIPTSKKFHAHTDTNDLVEGQTITIEETRPRSKTVCWTVVSSL